ncbi:MAG TPA: hypothetical protein EYP85_06170 [Armatimonadetes bacterium]|nr:hypothetical protein [Armatimonadota bacterium]
MRTLFFTRYAQEHPWARRVALLLIGTLVTTIVTWGPYPVQAQFVKPVIVLDFDNRSGFGGKLLGSVAAAALVLELGTKGYEVQPQDEVQREIAALGLRPPYDPSDLQRLGARLDVEEVITGEVLRVVTHDEPPMSAAVVIAVRVYDVDTGELVNGGIGRGESAPTGFVGDIDVLINEALERAARDIVKQILARRIITGSVLIVTPRRREVTINRGARDGVYPGLEMAILRDMYDPERDITVRRRIGTIRVRDVTPDDAVAEIIEAPSGVRTGDRVRAIFKLPRVEVERERARIRRPTKFLDRLLKFLGPLALFLIVYNITRRDSTRTPPDTSAVTLYQEHSGMEPVIIVRWHQGSVPSEYFIGGWYIYRSTYPHFNATPETLIDVITDPSARSYTDFPQFFTGSDIEITVRYIDAAGQSEEEATVTATYNHPMLTSGTTYYYRVRRVGPPFQFPPIVGGERSRPTRQQQQSVTPDISDDEGLLSNPSGTMGPITYISTPSPLRPLNNSSDRRVDDILFEWQIVPGATEYVVEIFTNPNAVGRPLWRSPIKHLPSGAGVSSLFTEFNEQAPGFVRLTPRTRYYWRVGARSGKPGEPLPQPDGFVYSEIFTFETAETPPSPP